MENTSVRPESLAPIARDATFAQDACNLSGVAHAFSRAVSVLWDEANATGRGTDFVNTHPVSKLYAYKLFTLAFGYEPTGERVGQDYFSALNEVEKISK